MQQVLLQRLGSNTVGDGALFLIVGGLFMLGLVVALVILRSIFPSGTPSRGLRPDKLQRSLLPTNAFPPDASGPSGTKAVNVQRMDEGRAEAARLKPESLEQALDHFVQRGWGQPRILRHQDDHTVIRLQSCAECDHKPAEVGCSFQAGYLEGTFRRLQGAQARISETSCARFGQPACEFEVQH